MKKDSRIITLRVLIFDYTRTNASPPEFKTLVGGFEAVSVCESTGRIIDVFDVATHNADIFEGLCCWLNEQGGNSPIWATLDSAKGFDFDEYRQIWKCIMGRLDNFPARRLISHQQPSHRGDSTTPEERARKMLAEVLCDFKDSLIPRISLPL